MTFMDAWVQHHVIDENITIYVILWVYKINELIDIIVIGKAVLHNITYPMEYT